ncbi:MAG TPA: hypothetical protein VFL47_03860 [Flavisolibacter sp.]|nr:hypothetical protein [Flavisolibacter sp.]
MNEKTTSDIIITSKLQHLPLPDLEDAIWARVKAQLDSELPSDDDGGRDPGSPPGGGWTWTLGTFVFLAAFVAVFLYFKKPNQQPVLPTANPTQTLTESISTPIPQQSTDSGQNFQNKVPVALPPRLPDAVTVLPVPAPADSASGMPDVRLPAADTLQRTTVVLTPPVQVDTTKPTKKIRGVPGITDNDYRIVPAKRDSS